MSETVGKDPLNPCRAKGSFAHCLSRKPSIRLRPEAALPRTRLLPIPGYDILERPPRRASSGFEQRFGLHLSGTVEVAALTRIRHHD